jgi:RNA polymerase sigma-70 factor, ECF subfamily
MAPDADRNPQESEWISRVIIHNDAAAFASLVTLHQSALRQFLRRLTRDDWSRADDIAQETFWKAYRYIASYQGTGKFVSWLFRIGYQIYISQQRKPVEQHVENFVLELEATEDSSEQVINASTVQQLLATLDEEERNALLLHYRYELTHTEIADALGIPLGTVKSLIRRARMKLQQLHEPDGEENHVR